MFIVTLDTGISAGKGIVYTVKPTNDGCGCKNHETFPIDCLKFRLKRVSNYEEYALTGNTGNGLLGSLYY